MLIRWILFYESIYELDDVERPSEKIINDDDRLDMWFDNYKTYQRQKLIEYHKSQKTRGVNTGEPRPLRYKGNPNG